MLRARIIRPGIVTNEKLAALGMEATLLFERLWMLADREGRLQDRPIRIRVELFPYWPDFPVEKALENLCQSGFLFRYVPDGSESPVLLIVNFRKHQHVHPHEAPSTLPPPQVNENKDRRDMSLHSRTLPGMSGNVRECQGTSTSTSTSTYGGVPLVLVESTSMENSPPKTAEKTERKPPAAAAENPPPQPTPEDIRILRESLNGLAAEIHMRPPDDAMLRRVFAAGHGATATEIHKALVALYKGHRFDAMRSWGLIPALVADRFGRSNTMQVTA